VLTAAVRGITGRCAAPTMSDLLVARANVGLPTCAATSYRCSFLVALASIRRGSAWAAACHTRADEFRASRLPAGSRPVRRARANAHAAGLRGSLRPTGAPVGLDPAEISLNEPKLAVRPCCETSKHVSVQCSVSGE
jgi:hypothetical protein